MKGRLKRNVEENLSQDSKYSGGGSSVVFSIPETHSIIAQSAEGNFIICKVDKHTAQYLNGLISERKYTVSFRRIKALASKEYSILIKFPDVHTVTGSPLLYGPYPGTPISKDLIVDMILEHRLTIGAEQCHINV